MRVRRLAGRRTLWRIRPRDVFEHGVHRCGLARGQVGQRHHADHAHARALDDDDAAQLAVGHQLLYFTDGLVLETPGDVAAHHVPDLAGIRREAVRGGTDRDVAVGDHADQPLAVADGQGADVQVAHQLGGPLQAVGRRDGHDVVRHDLAYGFHGSLLDSAHHTLNPARCRSSGWQAAQPCQRALDGDVQRRMRFRAQHGHEPGIVQAHRLAPQVAHLPQLAQGF
ncbi:conserved hypothetical protein, partial [Ricinus communis]